MRRRACVVLVLLVCKIDALLRRRHEDDSPPCLVLVPIPNATDAETKTTITVLDHLNGRRGYLVRSRDSFTLISAEKEKLETVSKQAKYCDVATNGGPFQSNGDHVGDHVGGVIVDSQIVSNDFRPRNVGFGISSRHNSWILGGIANASEAHSLGVSYYVTGLFGWLVYKDKNAVATAGVTKRRRAPRTAIGVDRRGNLLVLVVDGCEACLLWRGLTLEELANVLVQHGAAYAINLDGGSSSTLVVNGHVRNVPTCHDIPYTCERPVKTIVCLSRLEDTSDKGEPDVQ